MFWNKRINEKEVLSITHDVIVKRTTEVLDDSKESLLIREGFIIVLREATWTKKYPSVHEDKLKAIDMLEFQIDQSKMALQKLFCVNCKHISTDNANCDHGSNICMNYVTEDYNRSL